MLRDHHRTPVSAEAPEHAARVGLEVADGEDVLRDVQGFGHVDPTPGRNSTLNIDSISGRCKLRPRPSPPPPQPCSIRPDPAMRRMASRVDSRSTPATRIGEGGHGAIGMKIDDERALTLKVTLVGSKPPIWRRVVVRERMTLPELHDVIQEAMDIRGAWPVAGPVRRRTAAGFTASPGCSRSLRTPRTRSTRRSRSGGPRDSIRSGSISS